MKCAHLIASQEMQACSALEKPYMPSLFELGEYCKKKEHRKCPFYLRGIISMDQAKTDSQLGPR